MTAKEDFEKRIRGSSWTNKDGGNSHLTESAISGLSRYAENTYGKLNETLAGFNKALIEEKAALRTDLTSAVSDLDAEAHNGDSLRKELDRISEMLGKCVKCGLALIDQRAEKSKEIERLQNLLQAAVDAGDGLHKRLEDKTAECEYVTEQINRLREFAGDNLPSDACAEDVVDYCLGRPTGSTSPGVDLISDERYRQVDDEGWSEEHDARVNYSGQLTRAASCYLSGEKEGWPWAKVFWKPTTRQRDLVKAGALIAAELDRLIAAEAMAA